MSQPKNRRKSSQTLSQQSQASFSETTSLLPLEHDSGPSVDSGAAKVNQTDSVSQLSSRLQNLEKTARSLLGPLKEKHVLSPVLAAGLPELKKQIEELLQARLLEMVLDLCGAQREIALSNASSDFQAACQKRNLDVRGGFPDFIVNGMVYVGIEPKRLKARVDEHDAELFPIERLADQVSEAVSGLSAKAFDAEVFLRELWRAWNICARSEKSNAELAGGRVPIYELLPTLALVKQSKAFQRSPAKESFHSYSQSTFRADLFRLLITLPHGSVSGKRLVIEPTSVAEQGLFMFLPTVGRCAFVGHLLFTDAE